MTAAIPDFEHFPTLYYFTTSIHYKQYKKTATENTSYHMYKTGFQKLTLPKNIF